MLFQRDNSHLEVTVVQVDEAIARNTHTVVDVREVDEWQEGHIAEAIHIPLGDLAARAGELPASQPIYTVCRSGKRSITAIEILESVGVAGARSMAGGMIAWHEAGKPIVG
jgi:rhodanese-related sulfurtransferase